jgi:hypothetical protein
LQQANHRKEKYLRIGEEMKRQKYAFINDMKSKDAFLG